MMASSADSKPCSRVVDPDAEANQALATVKIALATGDHRRVVDAWIPLLDSFSPAQTLRPQYHLARAHLEKLQRLRQAAILDDDSVLAEIWASEPKLDTCSCAATERLDGGLSISDRASLAGQRLHAIHALQEAIAAADQKQVDTGCFQEAEESAILSLWSDPRSDLAASKHARDLLQGRVNQARQRFTALRALESLLRADDDDAISKAWPPLAHFAPALLHQARAEDAIGRMKTLADFIAQLRKEPNHDADLWSVWARRSDMDRCKPASRPLPQFGGLVPAQRAALARKRVEALDELKQLVEARGHLPLDESSEREILAAWRQREAILSSSIPAGPYRKRAEEAQKRLRAWDLLQKGLADHDDEPIATAWQSGLLAGFGPAQPFAAQCADSADRMRVLADLVQRHQENPEDEAGFLRLASARPDLAQCRPFLRPSPALNGRTWQERLALAARLLDIRGTLTTLLARDPPPFDQVADAWDESLCRGHSLFAADLPRIVEVLELSRLLNGLRHALDQANPSSISGAWRDEFQSLVTHRELERVGNAMRAHFTGPNCLQRPELSLEGETLTVRWEWRDSGGFCFVAADDGHYPDPPASAHPNGFQGGASGGLCTLPFSGESPYVRIWAMFRFLDQFLLGQQPTRGPSGHRRIQCQPLPAP